MISNDDKMNKYNVGDMISYAVQDDKTVYTSKVRSYSRYTCMFDDILGKWRDVTEYYVENYCGFTCDGVVFDFQIKE